MKLIAYFSTSGTTKAVAEELAEKNGADLFEIKAAVPYTSDDLDWNDRGSRCNTEMENNKVRPAIANTCDNIDEYDTIYLGFPLWWGYAPRIINTFLESYDFKGKTIIPFATSGGSEYGRANDDLIPSAPDAHFEDGKRLT